MALKVKEALGKVAGQNVSAETLGRLLRQMDPSSAIVSDEGIKVFMSMTPKESDGQIRLDAFVDWLFADDDSGLQIPDEGQSTISVFWSNHQTPTCRDARLAWMAKELGKDRGAVDEEAMNIKASMPPFNIDKTMDLPKSVLSFNVPVYGPNIPNSVMKIFDADDIRELAQKELYIKIPSYSLNRVVQSKMSKVLDLVNAARGLEDIAQRNGAAIDAVENFAKAIQGLNPEELTGSSDWSAFVKKYARDGWERKLHFDHLLDNFGFDKEASDVLRKQEYIYPDGEAVTLESHAFRWLSKAFAAYGVEGCLTDVVNLIFAMMGIIPKDLDEHQIAKYVDQFREEHFAKRDFSALWVPSYFVMDAETDDSLAWIILECAHKARGTELKTFVQFPAAEELDRPAAKLEQFRGVHLFRDPPSKNKDAVMQNMKRNMGCCYCPMVEKEMQQKAMQQKGLMPGPAACDAPAAVAVQ